LASDVEPTGHVMDGDDDVFVIIVVLHFILIGASDPSGSCKRILD
jgi:hypothetical protein